MVTSARYCDLVRERRDTYNHRLRLVESAKQRGIKPTARLFTTSPLTVRKGWRRYPQHGPSGLQEHSRVPHRHPLKTSADVERKGDFPKAPGDSQHVRIPPAAHTYKSDVETVHRLEEDEFFVLEEFRTRGEFLAKVPS